MKKKIKPAIVVKDLTKSFRIPLDKNPNLKTKILHGFKGKGYRDFTPLKGISFTINEGEFFGIVGRNGSGKSTLLKSMAGIYTPDGGSITVNGTLVPFIELGVGFNPDLSGRENVYLNGALLGFSRKEIDGMYEEIVDFAELHDFMEERLRNYSSGMQVRLAFSIAIRAKGDILLLDEVLAVGDSAFQQKCLNYFAKLKREKHTVVLVSHGMSSIERYCDRALLLENGEILDIGESSRIANLYEELFLNDAHKKAAKLAGTDGASNSAINKSFRIDAYIEQDDKSVTTVKAHIPFTLCVFVESDMHISSANIGVNIRNDKNQIVYSIDSRKKIGDIRFKKGDNKRLKFTIDNYYTNGNYSVDVHMVDEDAVVDRVLSRNVSIMSFSVVGVIDHAHSLFHPNTNVEIEEYER